MGGKITIDSATLMNKGLEVIEAHHLFGTPYDAHRRRRAPAVDHPRAGVRSATAPASAHMGYPDMRVPIAYALHHPERVDVPVPTLDLAAVGALTFEAPDLDAFPCLRLRARPRSPAAPAPCVLNAANEVAVHAFLGGRLPFMGIPAVIEQTLERIPADRRARLRLALRGRRRRAGGRRRAGRRRSRRELAAGVPGLRGPDRAARARPLRRGQGGRHARRALRAVLPAAVGARRSAARPSTRSARSRSAAT